MISSRRALVAWVALALLLGCASVKGTPGRTAVPAPASATASSGAPPVPGDPRSEPQAFAFDWGAPCRVPVVESVTRKGRTVVNAYKVAVRPGNDRTLHVFLEDFEFRMVDGQEISAAQREQLKPVLELTAALPFFEIDEQGQYLRCEGLEEMVERMTRLLRMPKDRAEKLRNAMSSPRMAAMMQESMGSYWATWVGSWIAWELAPGASTTRRATRRLGTGEVPAELRQEYLGLRDGYASLRQTTTMSGKAAAKALVNLVTDVSQQAGSSGVSEDLVQDARLEVELYAETTRIGLRPRHTRLDKKFEIRLQGGEQEGRELRDVTWDWEHAEGCRHPAR